MGVKITKLDDITIIGEYSEGNKKVNVMYNSKEKLIIIKIEGDNFLPDLYAEQIPVNTITEILKKIDKGIQSEKNFGFFPSL